MFIIAGVVILRFHCVERITEGVNPGQNWGEDCTHLAPSLSPLKWKIGRERCTISQVNPSLGGSRARIVLTVQTSNSWRHTKEFYIIPYSPLWRRRELYTLSLNKEFSIPYSHLRNMRRVSYTLGCIRFWSVPIELKAPSQGLHLY